MQLGSFLCELVFPWYLFVRITRWKHYPTVSYAKEVWKIVEFSAPQMEVDTTIFLSIKSEMTNSEACLLDRPKGRSSVQRFHIQDGPFVGLEAVFM